MMEKKLEYHHRACDNCDCEVKESIGSSRTDMKGYFEGRLSFGDALILVIATTMKSTTILTPSPHMVS